MITYRLRTGDTFMNDTALMTADAAFEANKAFRMSYSVALSEWRDAGNTALDTKPRLSVWESENHRRRYRAEFALGQVIEFDAIGPADAQTRAASIMRYTQGFDSFMTDSQNTRYQKEFGIEKITKIPRLKMLTGKVSKMRATRK